MKKSFFALLLLCSSCIGTKPPNLTKDTYLEVKQLKNGKFLYHRGKVYPINKLVH